MAFHVRSLGKVAIHIGGALQLFFQITGRRWANMHELGAMNGLDWIRPSKNETPFDYEKHEGGAYW